MAPSINQLDSSQSAAPSSSIASAAVTIIGLGCSALLIYSILFVIKRYMGRTYLTSEERVEQTVSATFTDQIQAEVSMIEAAFEPVKLRPKEDKPASEMDIADSRDTLYDIMMRQEQIHEPLPLRVF